MTAVEPGGARVPADPERPRSWDMGDPEPEGVKYVLDYTAPADFDEDPADWGKTASGWKGYKNGGKTYLSWAELVRRWGPVEEGRWAAAAGAEEARDAD